MEAPALTLLVLALVVTVYLLPLLIRSRKVMGQARVEDRFSEQLRVLPVQGQLSMAEARTPVHTPQGLKSTAAQTLHEARPKGGNVERPMTRSVKIASASRDLAKARAARAAAISNQAAAAKRWKVLLGALTAVALGLAVLAGVGILGWGWLALPATLGGLSLAGAWRAHQVGARQEGAAEALITQLQAELERLGGVSAKKPVGRSAVKPRTSAKQARLREGHDSAEGQHVDDAGQDSLQAEISEYRNEEVGVEDVDQSSDVVNEMGMGSGHVVGSAARVEGEESSKPAGKSTFSESWLPPVIPPPQYVAKPAVWRKSEEAVQQAPSTVLAPGEVVASSHSVQAGAAAGAGMAGTAGAAGTGLAQPLEPEVATGGLADFDAALIRRRAVGA